MSLDDSEVRRIAHLARLQVAAGDEKALAEDLGRILELVERMDRVDTSAVSPMAHPLDTFQRLRPDEVTEGDQHARFQAIAPAVADGLYLVPRVVE
jgi:aspartyl-tRNA(Asn)/glutamyl-tRNA(Gln) amidotransferase subunit C